MFDRLNQTLNDRRFKELTDPRNIGLYVFALIVLAIAWSGVRTMQSNYELQKKISVLKQQNTVLRLQNQTTELQNKYYSTDEYSDLAARQYLGLAGPGEKVMLVSKNTALKYVSRATVPASSGKTTNDNRSRYIKNLEDWRDFLLGRKLFSD